MAKYWIKLYHEILDDPKMCRLPDTLYRRVIEVLLLAGKLDTGGILPCTEDIAWHLRLDHEKLQPELEAIEYLTKTAEKPGIIQKIGGGWLVTNFAKRQDHDTDAERKRYQRQRDRKDNLIGTKRDSNVTQNVTESVTTSVRELDIDIDKNRVDTGAHANPDPFDELSVFFAEKSGYPIPSNQENILTITEWVNAGILPSDIEDAIAYFSTNGNTARTPVQIHKSVMTARARRIQAQSKSRKGGKNGQITADDGNSILVKFLRGEELQLGDG